ncbi:MAG: hypothetical protein KDA88_16985 [Planctomycetaceae bacterium]|nr:hypothetical protein [Planctomycetaceae bacterium]
MKLPVFRIDQFEYCVKRMELDSVLDYGTTVRLWTGSWISGLKRGAKVSLALSGLEYELVVQDFSMPHSGGCGGTIDLCDPVLAGKPFEDESFSAEAADTELDAVIKSRVAIAEPLTPMFPAIVASRI